jgi:hypothetical protein
MGKSRDRPLNDLVPVPRKIGSAIDGGQKVTKQPTIGAAAGCIITQARFGRLGEVTG